MATASTITDLQTQQQLAGTQDQAHEAMMEGKLVNLHTAMPGIVTAYDAASQTVTVQPVCERLFIAPNLSGWQKLPLCPDVPVHFPAGGGVVFTFPIAVGDEGLLVFCERSIDEWFQNGGTNAPQRRLHNLSDAVFVPGISSTPRAITEVSTTAAELRTRDGAVKLSLSAEGIVITGNVVVNGTITATDVATASGTDLATHVHPYGAGVPPPNTLPPLA
jgi:phage baseplate assembly protein gpV